MKSFKTHKAESKEDRRTRLQQALARLINQVEAVSYYKNVGLEPERLPEAIRRMRRTEAAILKEFG